MSENDPTKSVPSANAGPARDRKPGPGSFVEWLDRPADPPPEQESEPNVNDSQCWAELPRLEISDQASGTMSFKMPGQPSKLVPPLPSATPGDLLPPPPGMIVLNDDFAGLSRLARSAPPNEPRKEAGQAEAEGTAAFRLPTPSLPTSPPAAPFRVEAPPTLDSPAHPLRPSELRELRVEQAGEPAAPPPTVEPPAPFMYGMVLRNPTSVPMNEVLIEHDLPDGPSYLGAEPEPRVEGRRLVWDLGTVGPGALHRVRVRVQPTRAGEVPEDATARFRVHQCLESRTRLLRPSLAGTLTAPESVAAGERLALSLTVRNDGHAAASGVRAAIALPEGMAFAEGAPPRFDHARLAVGEQCRFETAAVVERAGDFAVQAYFAAGQRQPRMAQATVTATPPELHLRVEGPPRVAAGERFDCRLDVSNLGEVVRETVQVSLRLPEGVEVVERAGGELDAGERRLSWRLDALPPRESRGLAMTFSAARAGEFVIRIETQDGRGHRAVIVKTVTVSAPASTTIAPEEPEALAGGQLFVAFVLADHACAVPAENVREVSRPLPVTPRRNSPDWLPGTVSVRGEIVPLIDLRRLLHLPPGGAGHLLIVRAGDTTAALLADAIAGIRYLTPAAPAETSGSLDEFTAGSAESDGRRLVLLDVDKMLREVAVLP